MTVVKLTTVTEMDDRERAVMQIVVVIKVTMATKEETETLKSKLS